MVKKKRISTRIKGRNAELMFKKIAEEAGWQVTLVQPPKKYNLQNDFCGGLFDAICSKNGYWKFVQIKCNRMIGKKERDKYIKWGDEYGNRFISVEVWVKLDNKPKNERWMPHLLWWRD